MFEKDIFISYAHIDDMALKEGERGWVANFHRALEVRLAQLMGETPHIWRDQKLQGNDFFSDEIVEQFPKTAVMLSILSPRYIKSGWCTKEMKEFYETAAKGVGTKIGSKSRIFKVVKTAVPYDAHPPEVADTLGYEFFVSDPITGRMKELSQKIGGELEQIYWARLDDIAHDICDLLVKLKQTGETGFISRQPREQLTVYLAETGIELSKQRDMIKRGLMEFGFDVLPDTRLPAVESEFKKSVDFLLDQCVLSIHMVGGSYGPVPENSQESIVCIQNELAARKSKTGKLQRLIWLQPGYYTKTQDPREKKFVEQLRTNPEAQYGADFFETRLEDFKFAIRDKLKSLSPAAAFTSTANMAAAPGSMTVYLAETNYELRDQRELVKQRLMEQGCNIVPTQPLPLVYPELVKTLDLLLEQCDISIHLLGADYGIVPDKTEKSIVCIQAERAAEISREKQMQRLICVSPETNQTDERQREFINCVKGKENIFPNDEIFETPIEQMASVIMEKFKVIEEKKHKKKDEETPAPVEQREVPRQVYLICEQRDLDHTAELEDFLFDNGYDVILPAFEGEEEELIRDHQENLKSCDAAVIYYGAGNELWMRSISRDLTKIAGYGRPCPLQLKAVFLAPPAARAKERFRSHDFLVINGMEGFSPPVIKPFIETLKTL